MTLSTDLRRLRWLAFRVRESRHGLFLHGHRVSAIPERDFETIGSIHVEGRTKGDHLKRSK